jgi:hypothetical protein
MPHSLRQYWRKAWTTALTTRSGPLRGPRWREAARSLEKRQQRGAGTDRRLINFSCYTDSTICTAKVLASATTSERTCGVTHLYATARANGSGGIADSYICFIAFATSGSVMFPLSSVATAPGEMSVVCGCHKD